MNLIAMVLAIQMFFPIFESSNNNYGALALTNVSSVDGEFTVRLMSPDGQETGMSRLPIESGHQKTVAVGLLRPTSPTPFEGWVRVDATTDHFTAYLVSGTGETLAGIEPASRLAVASYLPHIRLRTGFTETIQTDTAIAVVNPSAETASVTIRLVSYDRSVATTAFVSVPAQGSRSFRASSLLPSGTTQFQGRATVHSFSPVAAWQRVETPLAWSALRARSEGELGLDTSMTAPYFVFGGDFQSSLTLWNPAGTPITLEAAAYDSQGMPLGERVRIPLEPGQALASAVESLFRIPVVAIVPSPMVTGSITLREAGNRPFRVYASIETTRFDTSHRAAMLYWLRPSAAQAWEIPIVAQNEQYFTGYSILASEWAAYPTNVTIEVHNLNGDLVQRIERSLPPRSADAGVIGPAASGAYMRVWANQPVSVLGSVGTLDGRLFDAVVPSR